MISKPQPPFLKCAIADGLVNFTGEGKNERIHYLAADHTERWADPEEKVRAEFWAELIYKYEYRPERIRIEVKVPRRTPNDFADLVIYGDKEVVVQFEFPQGSEGGSGSVWICTGKPRS